MLPKFKRLLPRGTMHALSCLFLTPDPSHVDLILLGWRLLFGCADTCRDETGTPNKMSLF